MVEDSQLSIGKLDNKNLPSILYFCEILIELIELDLHFALMFDQRLDFPVEVQGGVTWNWPHIFWLAAALKLCARCHRFCTISNKAGR